jgi:hypothetical protein
VAYPVLLFGAESGRQFGEEALYLLLVHLFEVGHPLAVHASLLS